MNDNEGVVHKDSMDLGDDFATGSIRIGLATPENLADGVVGLTRSEIQVLDIAMGEYRRRHGVQFQGALLTLRRFIDCAANWAFNNPDKVLP